MKPKNPYRHFWRIIIILAIIYCGLLIALESGYYQTKMQQKAIFTTEQIKKFEQDVAEGKKLDLEQYLPVKTNTYQNNIAQFGLSISNNVEKFMAVGINDLFGVLGKLFSN